MPPAAMPPVALQTPPQPPQRPNPKPSLARVPQNTANTEVTHTEVHIRQGEPRTMPAGATAKGTTAVIEYTISEEELTRSLEVKNRQFFLARLEGSADKIEIAR
ncbi:hypothetical protein HYFRA_00007019 [Hymenoscyphus fraxineus]|uniref:Uncharacterized protein n=1 Tax=Hymenoscyphus fraxineus TaxID=746836 RepID=A0A9N9KR50_9HELO|nr:hypothetical protein HYFRA_00007019 [Hymenoscyphus fraxineus]